MIFQNPWGLLGLVAIPLIMALHFFRSRRHVRRIGGLHLWADAPSKMPPGRNLDRILRSFSLLFQLLAALLLSLLLAGLDSPDARSMRHYTAILDESISVTASDKGSGESPAARAQKLIKSWAPESGRFTLLGAGAVPRVIAGPFAARQEMLNALEDWKPEAPTCDLESAISLASKFAEAGASPASEEQKQHPAKIIFATDDANTAKARAPLLEIAALGRPLANVGFAFAERIRVDSAHDRVVTTLKNYSASPATAHMVATVNNAQVFATDVQLAADAAVQQSFDTSASSDDVHVELSPDPLLADNVLNLAPVAVKFVRIGRTGLDAADKAITGAVKAVPYTTQARPEACDLLISDRLPPPGTPARVVCIFRDEATSTPIRAATGAEIRPEPGIALFDGVSFEGALWPFNPGALSNRPGIALWATSAAGSEALAQRSEALVGPIVYTFNVRLAQSNLFKQPAWPLLIKNLIEETRQRLPGLPRSSYNAGEKISLNIEATTAPCELRRDGKVFQSYERPPLILAGLNAGVYDLTQGETPLAHFTVNMIAPDESDLRNVTPAKPDFKNASGAEIRAATLNPAIYYALLLSAFASIAGAWVCQDRSR